MEILCKARVLWIAVPLLLAVGSFEACGPGDTKIQLKSTLATGIVSVQNPTGGLVDFVVSDSTGRSTALALPPHTKSEVRVATGDVSVTGTPRHNVAPTTTERLTIARGKSTALIFASGVGIMPTTIQANLGTGLTDHGIFECQNGSTAQVRTATRASQTIFTISCEEPRTAQPHTLTAAFDSSTVVNNLPPDPMRSCLQKFEGFAGSRTQNYFRMNFNAYSMDCQAAPDKTTAAITNSMGLGDSSSGGSSNGVMTALAPAVSQFGAPTTYGQLTYEIKHTAWNPGYEPDVTYTYPTEYTIDYGGTPTNVDFRYQFPTDEYADGVWNFKMQLAYNNNSTGIVIDPCHNWDAPDGLLDSWDVSFGNSATALAGGLWQQQFTHQFNGLPGPSTLYLRIVPVDISGACSGGASNWLPLNVTTGGPMPDFFAAALAKAKAAAAAAAAKKVYTVSIDGYSPPTFAGLVNSSGAIQMIITKSDNGNGWPLGCGYTLPDPPPQAPWYEQVYSTFTSVWDWVSQAYESIKGAVVDVAASILNTLVPGLCGNDTCKEALMAGLDAGLTALGIPPNIPNSAMLTDAANGYVSATLADVASQQTDGDIPAAAFKPATDKLTEQIGLAQQSPTTDKYSWSTWGIMDPYFQDRPAILWVRVTRDPDPKKVPTGFDTVGFYEASNNSDPGQPRIYKEKHGIRIPKSIAPGASILIPIVLEPALVITNDTQLESQNIDNAKGRWWTDAYKMGNGSLVIDMGSSGKYQGFANVVYGSGTKGILNPAPPCP